MTKHTIDHVREFHNTFGHPVAEKPTIPDAKMRLLRVKLIMEEAMEFAEASGFPCEVVLNTPDAAEPFSVQIKDATPSMDTPSLINIVEAADALADIDYVTQGANLVWGFPAQEIMDEVQASNMSKLGVDGKPIRREDGKILKGPDFFVPKIDEILKKYE